MSYAGGYTIPIRKKDIATSDSKRMGDAGYKVIADYGRARTARVKKG